MATNKGNINNKNQQVLLTANNILYEGGGKTLDKLFDLVYPVGSVYMSTESTSPATRFGGTWTQISGRFLYCTTTSKTTGGSTISGSTTLTIDQIPSHNHTNIITTKALWQNPNNGNTWDTIARAPNNGTNEDKDNYSRNTATGGGQGHTHPQNLPPYFTVYCWYRTA